MWIVIISSIAILFFIHYTPLFCKIFGHWWSREEPSYEEKWFSVNNHYCKRCNKLLRKDKFWLD